MQLQVRKDMRIISLMINALSAECALSLADLMQLRSTKRIVKWRNHGSVNDK
jgi:hypothetical protein